MRRPHYPGVGRRDETDRARAKRAEKTDLGHGKSIARPSMASMLISCRLEQTFSPDSRWLITSSMDSVVRTYDVPTGQLVDAFRATSIATGVTFSPTGDFLATSHVDSVGVHLWYVKPRPCPACTHADCPQIGRTKRNSARWLCVISTRTR